MAARSSASFRSASSVRPNVNPAAMSNHWVIRGKAELVIINTGTGEAATRPNPKNLAGKKSIRIKTSPRDRGPKATKAKAKNQNVRIDPIGKIAMGQTRRA